MSYGWRVAEPPVDPPNPPTIDCSDCEGSGTITEDDTPSTECLKCDGSGQVTFDPYDDPYAPDNWKEWEGIA
jgi:RecJ-like exonuclease